MWRPLHDVKRRENYAIESLVRFDVNFKSLQMYYVNIGTIIVSVHSTAELKASKPQPQNSNRSAVSTIKTTTNVQ
jgi:hypothetical protein